MSISVVIPAFNEEDAIAGVIKKIQMMFESSNIDEGEIIVVDDGSDDNTVGIARSYGAKCITHPHNMGYGFSLKTGILAAKYDTIAITDADGTYPVEEIPSMLELHRQGFDLVVGRRTGKEYRESALKSPLRSIFRFIVEYTAGASIPDINSGLRVFDRKYVIEHFNQLCNGFSFTTSMTLTYMMTNKFVTYKSIPYFKRVGKTKVRLFRDSLRSLQYIIQIATYFNPLKIYLLLAVITFGLSIAAFLITLLFGLVSTFLLGIGGLLASLIIFCLGLIADLLRQIMQDNKRPSKND